MIDGTSSMASGSTGDVRSWTFATPENSSITNDNNNKSNNNRVSSVSTSVDEDNPPNEDGQLQSSQNERDSLGQYSKSDYVAAVVEGNNGGASESINVNQSLSIINSSDAISSAQQQHQQQQTIRRIAQLCSQAGSTSGLKKMRECPLCFIRQPAGNFPKLTCCNHRSCRSCLVQYLQVEIMESRVQVTCPECNELLHPTDIYSLMVHHPALIEKYESFSLRRVLMTDPDTRWCPAPDCTYAVIASNCAACPQLKCERPGCGTLFCYHCQGQWHASQTCDEARKQRGTTFFRPPIPQISSSTLENNLKRGDIKACPRCRTYIVKMNDGSCNHMVCAMCSTEFCWLCLKEINDLHYLSPTGCTFWGKKPWTRKKKLLWQVGTLIGAPVAIALIAGLAIPGIIFGVPVFVGRKVNQRFAHHSKVRRRLLTTSSVIGSLVVSPVLAVMAVGVGVPIMLAYVYGVVPLSLCRNGGCGIGNTSSLLELNEIDDDEIWHEVNEDAGDQEKSRLLNDVERQDGTSVVTGLSINSGLSSSTTQHQTHSRLHVQAELCRRRPSLESGEKCNYEEASTKAMAGSQYYDDKSVRTMCSGQEAVSYCEEIASTVALAGSVIDAKSLTDSASDKMVIAQLCCRDRDKERDKERDLSPISSHHINDANRIGGGDDRPCSSNHIHNQSQQHPDINAHAHNREETTSCGSTSYKRRTRATSTASGSSSNRIPANRLLSHSNSQQLVNLVIATNTEGDCDEMMLMSEDAMMQLTSENSKNYPSTSTASNTNPIRSLFGDNGGGASTSSQGVGGPVVWGSGNAHVNESDQTHDRYRIRAFFDTMKQLVSDDVHVSNEPVTSYVRASTNATRSSAVVRHSGSVKSVTQFTSDTNNNDHSSSKLSSSSSSRNRTPSSSGSSNEQNRVTISTDILSSSVSLANKPMTSNRQRNTSKRRFFSNLFRRNQRD